MSCNILVVDSEAKIRKNICELLTLKGFRAAVAPGGREAVELFERKRPDAVILDLMVPDVEGLDVLQRLRQIDSAVPIITLTAYGDIRSAVNAIKQGAYDFLPKPPDLDHLVVTLNRAMEKRSLDRRVRQLDAALRISLESTLGCSDAVKKIVNQLQQIAASDFTILIEGEAGTGTTYLAKVIHSLSRRAENPFVKVSIGSMPDSIAESEFFGYEKGAFTGADRTKKGYFETADGGTLFIDNLDTISPLVQGKLLSILEDRQFFRLGNPVPVALDVRLIGVTSTGLLKRVKEGKFREDLFFRLSEVTLQFPPLRERSDLSANELPVMSMRDAEKLAIQKALAYAKGQKPKAASILQIDYKTLVRKMQEYRLS